MPEDKILDTSVSATIPAKQEQNKYSIPFVKKDGTPELEAGNFLLNDLFSYLFPIGSIYSIATDTDPNTFLIGVWQTIENNNPTIHMWQRIS